MRPRSRLAINIADLFELAAATLAVYAVAHLVGPMWALILAAILLVVGAEFAYDGAILRVPLPHRPRPRVRVAEARQRMAATRRRLARRLALKRADLADRFAR